MSQRKTPNLSGRRFNKWKVIGPPAAGAKGNDRYRWLCRCECGTERRVFGPDLRSGRSRDCGCDRKKAMGDRNRVHGMGETKLHARWMAMIARCENPKHRGYHNYGGRGIKVCKRWRESFTAFFADMGHPPFTDYQIDRIDNDKDYEPGNCRWVSNKTNSRNRKNVRMLTYLGETKPLNEWAEQVGLEPKTLYQRLYKLKWALDDAMTIPTLELI